MELTYKKPEVTPLFRQTYGNNICFEQPYNSITFPSKDMDAPLRFADRKVHRLLCTHAEQDIAHWRTSSPLSEKVEYQIRRQLADGEVSVETIAEQLHTSPRTVQRRLLQESTSFHELLPNLRHELALQYLQEESTSTLDIALKLGYNQASSFCTVFKSWTGLSPMAYREKG